MATRAWNFKDRTGEKIGRLTIVGLAPKQTSNNKLTHWICKCDCGNEKIVNSGHLCIGRTVSCGCWRKEVTRLTRTSHGKTETVEYSAWCGLKSRCLNPAYYLYHRYGGRGIVVCDRWLHSFENFLADMGERPPDKQSVERVNNNGNYEPGNCKWATYFEQGGNKSNNVILVLNGISKNTAEWSRITGISKQALSRRHKDGWTDYETLTTFPV